ncbi:copper amine oxidase N-terminal domain-containing protein [Paenibacillus taichungensis]|nr:copper amine oxidase N-terminal domain-containing protein [Paenibacillus taichungensis]
MTGKDSYAEQANIYAEQSGRVMVPVNVILEALDAKVCEL